MNLPQRIQHQAQLDILDSTISALESARVQARQEIAVLEKELLQKYEALDKLLTSIADQAQQRKINENTN